jgi:uncharacterized protein (DUF427 family)
MAVTPDPVGPGQESVWRYPRPPLAEPATRHLRIVHKGVVVADTRRGVRTLETSHPPTYYFPPQDIAPARLIPSPRTSFCEWKGHAAYWSVAVGDEQFEDAAWSYPAPNPDFAILKNYVAFYAAPFEGCFVDGEAVTPQPGGFYGGWITSHVAGPFKGVPGSRFW